MSGKMRVKSFFGTSKGEDSLPWEFNPLGITLSQYLLKEDFAKVEFTLSVKDGIAIHHLRYELKSSRGNLLGLGSLDGARWEW